MTPVFSYAVQPVTLRNLHSMDHSERQLVEEIASFVGADLRYDPLVLFGGNGDHQIDEMRWIMALIRSWNLARWMWWWKPQARTHRSRRSRSPTVAMYKASIMRILTASPSPKAIPLYPLVTSLSRDTKTHRVVNPGLQKPTGWVGEEALLIGFEGNESVRFFSTESICQCMFRPRFSYKNPCTSCTWGCAHFKREWKIWKSYTVLSSYLNFRRFPLASCLMKETWTNSSIAMWITSKQRLDLPPHPLTAAYAGLVRDSVLKMHKHIYNNPGGGG